MSRLNNEDEPGNVWEEFFKNQKGKIGDWLSRDSSDETQGTTIFQFLSQENDFPLESLKIIIQFCDWLLGKDTLERPDLDTLSIDEMGPIVTTLSNQLSDSEIARDRFMPNELVTTLDQFLETLKNVDNALFLRSLKNILSPSLSDEEEFLNSYKKEQDKFEDILRQAKAALSETDRPPENIKKLKQLVPEYEAILQKFRAFNEEDEELYWRQRSEQNQELRNDLIARRKQIKVERAAIHIPRLYLSFDVSKEIRNEPPRDSSGFEPDPGSDFSFD